jgi:hypothetical protein
MKIVTGIVTRNTVRHTHKGARTKASQTEGLPQNVLRKHQPVVPVQSLIHPLAQNMLKDTFLSGFLAI